MKKHGFSYDLSLEDTGPGEENHGMTSATEWFVVFYKDTVELAYDLPRGFIADDLSAHPVYRRVPYAHAFRTKDDKLDFVIINVHLYPDSRGNRKSERRKELCEIAYWICKNSEEEKDFIIVGDMNINNKAELENNIPEAFLGLSFRSAGLDICYL